MRIILKVEWFFFSLQFPNETFIRVLCATFLFYLFFNLKENMERPASKISIIKKKLSTINKKYEIYKDGVTVKQINIKFLFVYILPASINSIPLSRFWLLTNKQPNKQSNFRLILVSVCLKLIQF